MSQIYHIGSTSQRGAFYFHTKQLNGWVVADLDTGKCSLCNRLVTLRFEDNGSSKKDPLSQMESKFGLGQDEDKWLIDGDDLVSWLTNHSECTEVLLIFNQDGSFNPYNGPIKTVVENMVALAKKARKKLKGYEE